jgi:hypothetical protein
MNDNMPRRDWQSLMASSERCYIASHIYFAAAGIVFALNGWWPVGVAFVGMFLFLRITGMSQSVTADVEREYGVYRKELDEGQRGPNSWPA